VVSVHGQASETGVSTTARKRSIGTALIAVETSLSRPAIVSLWLLTCFASVRFATLQLPGLTLQLCDLSLQLRGRRRSLSRGGQGERGDEDQGDSFRALVMTSLSVECA
jgi:hypothetical protein